MYYFPEYISVAKRKAKAEKKIKKLRKKNPKLSPIQIEGRRLATTWWGKAWNTNLESYADFSNRIGRGRSYLRHGFVADLQISPGRVKALVIGSRSNPYQVDVEIKTLSKKTWNFLKKTSREELRSISELLGGDFPKSLGQFFTQRETGLFPSPREISFRCSCPDWAIMCKHVAATLYGVGARLDEDPKLFFTLRAVKFEDLVSRAIKEEKKSLVAKASSVNSERVMKTDDAALSSLFDIDFDAGEKKVKPRKSKPVGPVATKRKRSNSRSRLR